MKKGLSFLIGITSIVLLAVMVSSCEKEDEEILVGEWQTTSVMSRLYNSDGILEQQVEEQREGRYVYFNLKSNGTGIYRQTLVDPSEYEILSWSVDDDDDDDEDELVLQVKVDEKVYIRTYTIAKLKFRSMILTQEYEGCLEGDGCGLIKRTYQFKKK